MVDRTILASRLSALADYLAKLKTFASYTREQFLEDEDVHHLAERYLHLACECVLDVTQHVISDMGFRQPENYKDAMEVLREEGVLDEALAERLKGWMGFRNVLVHLYIEIAHGQSYDAIDKHLDELEDFAARMAKLAD